MRLYNINQDQAEKVGRIMIAYADDLKEVSSVQAGNIVVVTGLKVMMQGEGCKVSIMCKHRCGL